MAAVQITFQGMFYDKISRTYYENATMVGIAFLTDLTIGGGPIYPPVKPPDGSPPPGIWPNPPEGQAPIPSHPIALPGDPWWPPDAPKPPELPPPGSPPVILPGPGPVHPITPPPAIVVDYPGIGKVLVPQPTPPS